MPGVGMVAKVWAHRARGKNADELLQTILSGPPVKKVPLPNDGAGRVVTAPMVAPVANANAC